ncbi:hypothetical protein [Nesterenkonia pannonica]|uniref:hypothetical protein n=1 Tax=Nesterenkonia pannonica TaxID=1548602 RepID=UPI002164C2D5|nr:hypothetical protein [Nesterenkonia pannonica]
MLGAGLSVMLSACGGDDEEQSAETEQESIPSPTLEGDTSERDEQDGGDDADPADEDDAVPGDEEIPDRPHRTPQASPSPSRSRSLRSFPSRWCPTVAASPSRTT